MDAAASEFYDAEKKMYKLHKSSGEELSTTDMVAHWTEWVKKYPIISIEDGLDEDDWDGWNALTASIGDKVQLVGDDLFCHQCEEVCKEVLKKNQLTAF